MAGRFLASVSRLNCGVLAIALLLGGLGSARLRGAEEPRPAPEEAAGPFGLTKVCTVHLEIPAKEYEAMQPSVAAFPGPGVPPQPAQRQRARDSERNLFGTEFPWAEGECTADGQTLKKVGVRYAGDITYFVSTRGLKRPAEKSSVASTTTATAKSMT